MESEIFTGSTVEECIEKACSKLHTSKDKLRYEVLKEKHGLFKKTAEISVKLENTEEKDLGKADDKLKQVLNGTVCIKDGKIIVKDSKESGKPAKVSIPSNIDVVIDGKHVSGTQEVYASNIIEVYFEEIEKPQRRMDIVVSSNKLEVYAGIEYVKKNHFKLQDAEEANVVFLKEEVFKTEAPPVYKEQEIIDELKKRNIVYGIIEENLKKCTDELGIDQILIAKGIAPENDEDDAIDFKFDINAGSKFQENNGNIDFKSIGFVNAVEAESVIAIKIDGKEGHDGKDVYGNDIKRKGGKKLQITAGEGCEIREENRVIALRNGKAVFKNNKFSIVGIHEINSDVNLKTGNIKFVGVVTVNGNVTEGMSIESGNDVIVNNNVEDSTIRARGNVAIKKNAILSKIYAGGKDVDILGKIDLLSNIKNNITELIEAIHQVKQYNIGNKIHSDGELIKMLMENKFKQLPKMCKEYIDQNIGSDDKFVKIFNEKFIGIAPIHIENVDECRGITDEVEIEINNLKAVLSLPVDVTVDYCQDCHIESTGNIYITGKGEYISDMTANNTIEFVNKDAVARGGTIKAKNQIKCGVVGSVGYVVTKLSVANKGHIYAQVAYPNTVFAVGNKEYIVENEIKDVHAYIDHNDDLIVDKLLL